ncbi:MAG: amidohydrolase [Clostridia bacterium]|nr:amidohydrolase [Clostridia bacterium]
MVNNKFYVIDAHCHVYPEQIAEKAAQATGNFYGEMPFGKGTISDLTENGKKAGIDRFVVQSVATTKAQVRKINEFIAREVSAHSDTLIGLGTMHPESDDITADFKHLKSLGLHGVKLHPDIQGFKIDDYRCLKIYELCERDGLPILMHTGDYRYDFSNPNRLLPILKIYTGLTVIGAHFGGWSIWEEASKKLFDMPNLVVDCSSSLSYIKPELATEIIKRYGTDRVLFGTDYPLHSPVNEMNILISLGFSDSDYKKMFSENAIRVYKLE